MIRTITNWSRGKYIHVVRCRCSRDWWGGDVQRAQTQPYWVAWPHTPILHALHDLYNLGPPLLGDIPAFRYAEVHCNQIPQMQCPAWPLQSWTTPVGWYPCVQVRRGSLQPNTTNAMQTPAAKEHHESKRWAILRARHLSGQFFMGVQRMMTMA